MDTNPAPEGLEARCPYCGRRLTGLPASYHTPSRGGVAATTRFCSEECARAYKAIADQDLEDYEDIERAGAT